MRTRNKIPREDIVGTEEIARILGVKRETVGQWRHRYPDFPKPIREGFEAIWDWYDIVRWHNKRITKRGDTRRPQ